MVVGCFDTDEIFIIWSRTDAYRSTPSRAENQTSAISDQTPQQPNGKPQTLFNLSPIDWAKTHFLNVWLVVVPVHVEEPSAFKLPFIQWIYLLLFPEKRPASFRCVWDRWAGEKSVAIFAHAGYLRLDWLLLPDAENFHSSALWDSRLWSRFWLH